MANEDLAQAVKQALDAEKDLQGYDLAVRANGDKITITGVVDVLAEKWHAKRVAEQVAGVKEVEAAITVSTDGQLDDGDVRFEVGEELGLLPEDEVRQLSIQADKGVVTLRGTVTKPELAEDAVRAAAKARGVVDVISKIEVKD